MAEVRVMKALLSKFNDAGGTEFHRTVQIH